MKVSPIYLYIYSLFFSNMNTKYDDDDEVNLFIQIKLKSYCNNNESKLIRIFFSSKLK